MVDVRWEVVFVNDYGDDISISISESYMNAKFICMSFNKLYEVEGFRKNVRPYSVRQINVPI